MRCDRPVPEAIRAALDRWRRGQQLDRAAEHELYAYLADQLPPSSLAPRRP